MNASQIAQIKAAAKAAGFKVRDGAALMISTPRFTFVGSSAYAIENDGLLVRETQQRINDAETIISMINS